MCFKNYLVSQTRSRLKEVKESFLPLGEINIVGVTLLMDA